MTLTCGFMVVTPLDIIIQTWGAPLTGVKTFIVIAACALFAVLALLVYFSRLYKSIVAVNAIPSKSLYIPLEDNDLHSEVRKSIHSNLRRCVGEIGTKASALNNTSAVINHPGMSPPEYLQKRNVELGFGDEGTNIPPNVIYDNVVNSLALHLRHNGFVVNRVKFPAHFTFREIMVAALKTEKNRDDHVTSQDDADVRQMIELYEKFRYGPELICERDLVTFLVELENFAVRSSVEFLQPVESHKPEMDVLPHENISQNLMKSQIHRTNTQISGKSAQSTVGESTTGSFANSRLLFLSTRLAFRNRKNGGHVGPSPDDRPSKEASSLSGDSDSHSLSLVRVYMP